MKTPTDSIFEFTSRSPEQTRRLGERLGQLLRPGDTLCLQGDLGAGKTTFVQGLAQGWGSRTPVSSPTFVLVNQYDRPDGVPLYHLDTYRLQNALEAEILGLDDMLAEGALVIEWPEKILSALPVDRMWITIEHLPDEAQRQLHFSGQGARAAALLDALRPALKEIR